MSDDEVGMPGFERFKDLNSSVCPAPAVAFVLQEVITPPGAGTA